MQTRKTARLRRKSRIRAKIGLGSASRPRLAIFRSNKAIYVQVINDEKGQTLLAKSIKDTGKKAGAQLGKEIAVLCKKKGISRVIFDRAGWRYHGVIKELAESARKEGLNL